MDMEISIVIRCGDDERVFKCIDSIDEEAEIIISTSKNPAFQRKLEKAGIHYCISPRKNLSKISNIGFKEAKYDRVIITDSDTVFEKGCIRKLYNALDKHKVARAGIRFSIDKQKTLSRQVAEARDYVNSQKVVFTPGIAVRKDILPDIGGFLFNDPVPYAVDADLNYRIQKSGNSVAWLMKDAYICHSAEAIRHDLKAAYRIGKGCRISVVELRRTKQFSMIKWNDLKAVKAIQIPDIIRKKGISVALYQIIWDIAYWIGYAIQTAKRTR